MDALHNSLDFVRTNPEKKPLAIASDYAKYELASTGEYTQGGGAVAVLVSANPTLKLKINLESLQKVFLISLNQEKTTKDLVQNLQTVSLKKVEILQMNLFWRSIF